MTLEQFEQLLKGHDWYYDYSDDHSVWTRGREHANKIVKARQSLDEQNLLKEADELYNKYSPYNK